jgi:hypothetical protein
MCLALSLDSDASGVAVMLIMAIVNGLNAVILFVSLVLGSTMCVCLHCM